MTRSRGAGSGQGFFELTGQTEAHLVEVADGQRLHASVKEPFLELAAAARTRGFSLDIASGFRSFDRQLAIWNAKVSGSRPVLDANGHPIDLAELSDREKVFAILRWSALPGASRHHWGTDFDVWDKTCVPRDYRLQLVAGEYRGDGPFAELSTWLDLLLAQPGCPFYRPYRQDRGGIAAEPWHLSYRPVADRYAAQLTPEVIRRALEPAEMALKTAVLDNLGELFDRFVQVP